MRKVTIDREILAQELRLAALKGREFNYVLRSLRRDYDTRPIENQELLGKLNQAYDDMCFLALERKVKFNMVA